MNKAYPFQLEDSQFLVERKEALLAHEMGLGKSVIAILAINKLKAKKVLIVCPSSVKLNWKQELEKWLDFVAIIEVVNGSKHRIKKNANIIIVNYDLLYRPNIFAQLTSHIYGVGVFDESHYMKNKDAKRTQAAFTRGGIASRCIYKWFMTGTPVLNRPVELYPLLKATAPQLIEPYTTYTSFAKRWCGGYWDGVIMHAEGATNVKDLNERLTCRGFMLRRTKLEVLPDLPEKQYQILPVSIKAGRLSAKFMTWTKTDAQRVELNIIDGAELATFRHELAKEKLPHVIQHIEEILLEKPKLVVFAYHRDIISAIRNHFSKIDCAVIHGGVPSVQRHAEVKRFQTDPSCRLFIGQITAAGTGITLTAADTVLFAEISWVPGEIFQAADRVHRIGQKNNVLIQFLVVEGSIEENMLRTVIDKKITIEKIVEKQEAYIFT